MLKKLGNLKADLEDLPIIYEIDLTNEEDIGSYKNLAGNLENNYRV